METIDKCFNENQDPDDGRIGDNGNAALPASQLTKHELLCMFSGVTLALDSEFNQVITAGNVQRVTIAAMQALLANPNYKGDINDLRNHSIEIGNDMAEAFNRM